MNALNRHPFILTTLYFENPCDLHVHNRVRVFVIVKVSVKVRVRNRGRVRIVKINFECQNKWVSKHTCRGVTRISNQIT